MPKVISVKGEWFVIRGNVVKLGTLVKKEGKVVGVVEDVFGPTKNPYLKVKKLGHIKKGEEVVVCGEKMS